MARSMAFRMGANSIKRIAAKNRGMKTGGASHKVMSGRMTPLLSG